MAHTEQKGFSHEKIETSNFLLIVLTLLAVIWGGLVEIVPLFFQHSTTEPVDGLKPYTALQLAGRDVYIREGCYNCHCATATTPPRASSSTTTPSNGAPSAPDPTCTASAASTATNGTAPT
jgi:Cytochrome C oxidase, mono-heme subunit/FixO